MNDPKYPDIVVRLSGTDGNAFAIIGAVRRALKNARDGQGNRMVSENELKQFITEATSGDYDHVLATAMRWVEVY